MRLRRREAPQGLEGLLRAVLLDEAEERVQDDDNRDQDRIVQLPGLPFEEPEDRRDHRGDDEDDDEDIEELREEDLEPRGLRELDEFVRAGAREPGRHVGAAQAVRAAGEAREHVADGEGMPVIRHGGEAYSPIL